MINRLKEYASIFGKGLVLQMAPRVASGIINELFHEWDITVTKVSDHIQNNRSLWEDMTPEQKHDLKAAQETLGNLDFLTADLIIESIKTDFPGVASMLATWARGNEWLNRQVEILKANIDNYLPT